MSGAWNPGYLSEFMGTKCAAAAPVQISEPDADELLVLRFRERIGMTMDELPFAVFTPEYFSDPKVHRDGLIFARHLHCRVLDPDPICKGIALLSVRGGPPVSGLHICKCPHGTHMPSQ